MSLYEYWFNPSNDRKRSAGSGNMNLIRNASIKENFDLNCCISPILPTWSTRPMSTSSTSPKPIFTHADVDKMAQIFLKSIPSRRTPGPTVANFEGLLHDPVYRNLLCHCFAYLLWNILIFLPPDTGRFRREHRSVGPGTEGELKDNFRSDFMPFHSM